MTESKKIFCESVARLCNMAGCPELYAPIVKIASLCEAEGQQADPNSNTTIAQVDLNKLPQEELDSLQAEFAQSSEANKEVTAAQEEKDAAEEELDNAEETQTTINANLANKLNATAAEAEKNENQNQNPADKVNSEENA